MERKSSSYLCGVQWCFQTHCNTSREVGSHFGKALHFSSYLSLVMRSFTVFLYYGWPWQWRLQFLLVSLYGGACRNAVMKTLLLLVSSSFSCTTVSLVSQLTSQIGIAVTLLISIWDVRGWNSSQYTGCTDCALCILSHFIQANGTMTTSPLKCFKLTIFQFSSDSTVR